MIVDAVELTKALFNGGVGAALATGALAWWKARESVNGATLRAKIEAPADMLEAMGLFQSALNEQAKQLTEDLRKELRIQARRIEALEQENEGCREENSQVRGDLAQLRQWASSLEEILRRNNVPIPARHLPGSFLVLESERSTAFVHQPPADEPKA